MGEIYRFTLPYPWKRYLRGVYLINFLAYLLAIILSWNSFIRIENPPHWYSFWSSLVAVGIIVIALTFLFRYVALNLDKIKAPIEVWVDEYAVHFRKGSINKELKMDGLKTVRVVLNDKKVLVETNYVKDKDWKRGWVVGFKRKNELAGANYKEFIEKVFLPFTEVVIERLKELNPGIEVMMVDERKKYK